MAFSIDFDVASAEQRVDTLSAKLREMTNLANNAMQALTPSQKAVEELKKVADSQKTISESLTKSAAAAKQEAAEFSKANKDKETSAQKFVKQLEASIEKSAHTINSWSGAYGKATQDMVKANQTLARSAKELTREDETNKRAQAAALKAWISQHYREEQEAMNKRSAAWRAHYSQLNSEIAAAERKKSQAFGQNFRQKIKEEEDALKKRSAAWKAHYAEVNKEAEKSAREQAKLEKANHTGAQAAAGFRAALSALGMSFGIFTSSTILAATGVYAVVKSLVLLGEGLQQATTIGMEFEKSMYRTFAVTGQMGTAYEKNGILYVNTSKEIIAVQEEMKTVAREAAKVTVFTAAEAAEGMVALGMAGMKPNAAMGSLASSLRLAQIGMISVYESADIMTNVMLGFGMEMRTYEQAVESSALVTDRLASSITNSNATVKQMANALSYVAPVAHVLGGSIDEVLAGLEAFHNVGIKSQRAGTGMRRMYANLAGQTDKTYHSLLKLGVATRNTDGSMRRLFDIMSDLKDAGADAGDVKDLFGTRALPAALAYMNSLEQIRENMDRLEHKSKGVGKAMADFMATSSTEQWRIIQSKFADTQIAAFENFEQRQKDFNIAMMKLIDRHGSKWTELLTLLGDMTFSVGEFAVSTADAILGSVSRTANSVKQFLMYKPFADNTFQTEGPGDKPSKTSPTALFEAAFGSGKSSDPAYAQLDAMADMSGEVVAAALARVEANKRAANFARIEAEALNDISYTSFNAATTKKAEAESAAIDYRRELGLLTAEEALQQQINAIRAAKQATLLEFDNQIEPLESRRTNIIANPNDPSAEAKEFEKVAKEIATLLKQRDAQISTLTEKEKEFRLSLQKTTMGQAGFGTSGKGLAEAQNKVSSEIDVLRGNTQATDDNTLAKYRNEIAYRALFKESETYKSWTDDQRTAFDLETASIESQTAALDKAFATKRSLANAAEFAKRSDKDTESLSKFVVSLEVANEKLKHNTKAADENKLEKYRLSIVERELFQSSKDFGSWNDKQKASFIANTEAMKGQVEVAERLSDANKNLAEDIAKAKKMISGGDQEVTDLDNYVTNLRNSIEELKGNTEKVAENTLAKYQNVVATREQNIASKEFLALSKEDREAYIAKTEAMRGQLDVARQLSDEELRLSAAKEASDKFLSGDSLSDEGKGAVEYQKSLKQLDQYLANKEELMMQSGLTEIEIAEMVADARSQIDEEYWRSQHEHIANWVDTSAKALGDNLADVITIRQGLFETDEHYAHRYENRWKEAAREVSATMIGTMVSTMARLAAEEAANYVIKALFTKKKMALDSMETSNKIAGETAKQVANQTTAASSAAAETAGAAGMGAMLVQLGALVALGPVLSAALWPAATALSILTYGGAATAAIGPLLMAGAAGAAAAVIAGFGGHVGNQLADSGGETSGSRQFGGPVQKGKSYLVGETGREIFTPETNGYILNNQTTNNMMQNSGGSVVQVTYDQKFHVDARGNEDFEGRIEQAMETAATRSKQAVLADLVNNGDIAKQVRNVSRT